MTVLPNNLVTTKASPRQVQRLLALLPRIATGQQTRGVAGLHKTMLIRMGLVALSRIRHSFIIKSRGGTDEAGTRWAPLKPSTIAYSRRHPVLSRKGTPLQRRIPTAKTRSQFRPSWMLTPRQRDRWWALYRRFLYKYRGDKSHAAATAWLILKQEGAKTLIGVYGGMPAEILRDTGLLLNSLTPGIPESSIPDTPPSVPHQVFRLGRGEVIVGTNRKGGPAHHHGIPGRLPQRRLWPHPKNWPRFWWDDIMLAARNSLIDIAIFLVSRRGS